MIVKKAEGNFDTVEIIIDGEIRHSFETSKPRMKKVEVRCYVRGENYNKIHNEEV